MGRPGREKAQGRCEETEGGSGSRRDEHGGSGGSSRTVFQPNVVSGDLVDRSPRRTSELGSSRRWSELDRSWVVPHEQNQAKAVAVFVDLGCQAGDGWDRYMYRPRGAESVSYYEAGGEGESLRGSALVVGRLDGAEEEGGLEKSRRDGERERKRGRGMGIRSKGFVRKGEDRSGRMQRSGEAS